MIILSLFDGCSMARVALERAGIKVDKYYASEIDKYTMKVSAKNYPDIIQLGSITDWRSWDIEKPDLIIGGSPCQGFSFAGKQLNFQDERSKLFFEFVNILNSYKPEYFLLENVKMKKEHQNVISNLLGVEPILINSALVSAQNRKRLYWCNWDVEQPEGKNCVISDIKEICPNTNHRDIGKFTKYNTSNYTQFDPNNKGNASYDARVYFDNRKFGCLRAAGNVNYLYCDCGKIRRCSPVEWERLQTLPDNYTEGVSNSQRYKMLGNGFTVDVIAHILSNII